MVTRNQIYDYVESNVNTAARSVYCASVLEPIPKFFPACYITEISHYPSRTNIELDHDDEQLIRDFEVHSFSALQNNALIEAMDIMEDVETAMREIGFIETYCGQANNADPTVVHVVARFTRVFGGSDTI